MAGIFILERFNMPTGQANGRFNHGKVKHPLYSVWTVMKRKCYNKNSGDYLGGVEVCKEWKDDFNTFFQWAEPLWSKGLVLSRKKEDENFSPDNSYFRPRSEISKLNAKKGLNKAKQTKLLKYGKEHFTQTDEYKIKLRDSCLRKYGVEHFTKSDIVKQKIKNTCLNRYGTDNPLSSPEIQYKIKETNILKYGVEYPGQSKEIMDKARETMIKNGTMYYFNDNDSQSLADRLGISRSCMNARIRKYGYDLASNMDKRTSELEIIMSDLLDNIGVEYKTGINIGGKFPDFVLEKLIIETDGLYWHSDAVNSDKEYHAKKRKLYLDNGYFPLFFREDEIETKLDIVQSIIKNKLGIISNKVFARNCIVQEFKDKDISFFKQNHLMDSGQGKCIGLFKDGICSCALQYISKKGGIEISRFCNKLDTIVVGGFSRLLDKLPQRRIISFVDRRYGDGKYLENLGFKIENEDVSFRWVKNNKTFHRLKFKSNTGYDEGCYKIWDCGQAKYVRELK